MKHLYIALGSWSHDQPAKKRGSPVTATYHSTPSLPLSYSLPVLIPRWGVPLA